jgi:hypothetical protein
VKYSRSRWTCRVISATLANVGEDKLSIFQGHFKRNYKVKCHLFAFYFLHQGLFMYVSNISVAAA